MSKPLKRSLDTLLLFLLSQFESSLEMNCKQPMNEDLDRFGIIRSQHNLCLHHLVTSDVVLTVLYDQRVYLAEQVDQSLSLLLLRWWNDEDLEHDLQESIDELGRDRELLHTDFVGYIAQSLLDLCRVVLLKESKRDETVL